MVMMMSSFVLQEAECSDVGVCAAKGARAQARGADARGGGETRQRAQGAAGPGQD